MTSRLAGHRTQSGGAAAGRRDACDGCDADQCRNERLGGRFFRGKRLAGCIQFFPAAIASGAVKLRPLRFKEGKNSPAWLLQADQSARPAFAAKEHRHGSALLWAIAVLSPPLLLLRSQSGSPIILAFGLLNAALPHAR
jgi:hypothetical protein